MGLAGRYQILYVDFPGQRCQWVQNELLSVIFPDSLIPSVLGTSKVVTVSYNFPTGEHQFDTLIKNFVIQVEKTNKWLSDCFRPFRRSFQLEVFWTWLYAFTVQTMVFNFLLRFVQQFISQFQRSVQVSNQCYKPVTFLDLVIFPVILSNLNFYFSILRTRDTATGILNIQQIVLSNNFSSSPFLLSYFRSHFLYQAKPAYEQSIMLHVFVSVACKAYCYTFNLPNL